MEDDFDEFGNFVGKEYSESEAEIEISDPDDNITVDYINPTRETQSINEPLVKRRGNNEVETVVPVNWDFHSRILDDAPTLIRNVGVIGHLFHGKSSLCSFLSRSQVWSDTLRDGLTAHTQFCSILAENADGKTYVLNLADTPGHPDFCGDAKICLEACDFACLVVDVVEGILPHTRRTSKNVHVVVLNKIDRLILELRLNVSSAAERVKIVTKEAVSAFPNAKIVYASSKYGFSFTHDSINELYMKFQGMQNPLPLHELVVFQKFVLEPIYKLFSCGLLGPKTANALSDTTGITLSGEEWKLNPDERIVIIMSRYLEDPLRALTNVLIDGTPIRSDIAPSTILKSVKHGGYVFSLCTGPMNGPGLFIPIGHTLARTDKIGERSWCFIANNSPILPRNRIKIAFDLPTMSVGILPADDKQTNFELLQQSLEQVVAIYPYLNFIQSIDAGFMLSGSGELLLDTAIRELKSITPLDLIVSQPLPILKESVTEESTVAFPTKSTTGDFVVVITAKPSADISGGDPEKKILCDFNGCVLECLESIKVDGDLLKHVIEGFKVACAEGPLVSGALSGVLFTISELEAPSENSHHVAQTVQRACYASFLVASPKLLEPVASVYTVGKIVVGKALYREVEKRGGLIITDTPIYYTNLYYTSAEVPVIDSFGLGVDVLVQLESRDTGYFLALYSPQNYRDVSGDPLDSNQPVPRLQAAEQQGRARDFMVKIRKRLGLAGEPELEKFVDDDVKLLLF